MKCPRCGEENRLVALFCQRCGASLMEAELPEMPPLVPETPEGGREVSGEAQPLEEEVELLASEGAPIAYTSTGASDQPTIAPMPEPAEVPELQGEVWTEDGVARSAEQKTNEAEADLETEEIELEPTAVDVMSETLVAAPEGVASEVDGTEQEAPEATTEPEGLDVSSLAGEAPGVGAEEAESAFFLVEPAPGREGAAIAAQATGEPDVSEVQSAGGRVEEHVEEMSVAEAHKTGETAMGEEAPGETPLTVPAAEGEEAVPEGEEQSDVQELADAGWLPWKEASAPMIPLDRGTVIYGRYQVSEVLSREEEEILYRVRDLQRCPKCGFDENSSDEAFCASCGAAMDQKPTAIMLERPIEEGEKAVEAEVEDQFADGERRYWVWREQKKTGPLGGGEQAMRLLVGLRSDTGQVRELDEDSLLALTMSAISELQGRQLGLFVVADGMGGHEAGELASKVAIQTVATELLNNVLMPGLEDRSPSPDEAQHWMRRSIEAANDEVYLERQKRENDMGTTVTAALIVDWMLYLAHVGDCRAYCWGEDGLQQLTTDHSIVATMIAAGTVQPEEIYTHPQRSVIYRCVGDRPTVDVDVSTLLLSPGDRLLLCSDGLWEMTRDEGIEDVMMRESDPQVACDLLVDQANLAGGVDNISVIVVQL